MSLPKKIIAAGFFGIMICVYATTAWSGESIPQALPEIDKVKLKFDANSLTLLNVILGLIMFGIALDLRVQDFKDVIKRPKAPLIGLFAQLILLPAFTFLLAYIWMPGASIALGMIMISSCPGGNTSNFITHMAGGNTSLSISMTAVCNAVIIVMLPANFAFWGAMHPQASQILKTVELDPFKMLFTISVLLALPLALGMLTAHYAPNIAERARKPFKIFSVLFFAAFVVIAFSKNFQFFIKFISVIFFIVLVHNTLAYGIGYLTGWLGKLPARDRRAIAIEVGIQNTGLGLILTFSFFDGLGGMAMMLGWWGIWHFFSGFTLATIWNRIELPGEAEA